MLHAAQHQPAVPVGTGGDHRYARMVDLAELDLHAGSPKRVLSRVVAVVTAQLPADCGASVVLWDGASGRFTEGVSTATDGFGIEEKVRAENGASRWVVDHQQQLSVPDIADDPFGPNPKTKSIGAYVSTPIIHDGRSLGVLHAMNSEPRAWSDDDLVFLHIVAGRAAAAITGAKLTAEARQERERAEALSFVANALIGLATLDEVLQTIVDGAAAALAADHARLVRIDRGGGNLRRAVDGPMAGHEVPEGVVAAMTAALDEAGEAMYASLFTTDQIEERIDDEAGGVVVAPLIHSGRPIGFLCAARDPGQPEFEGADASLLAAMASQAVVAIENARLATETQEALAELSAVYEIVQAQNTEAGLEQMLGGIASAVAQALPAYRVTIAVADGDAAEVRAIVSTGRAGSGDKSVPLRMVADVLEEAIEAPGPMTVAGTDGVGPRLVVPLRTRTGTVGVLIAEHAPGGEAFAERQVELAWVMGSQVSVAVANALLFDETQRLAITDSLLGINNRRHLFTLGESAFGAAKRYSRALSCVMFDLDRFKKINDTYGHAVGDEVLTAVAQRVATTIRDVDIIGRYGGEEFGVVLPETGLAQAVTAAERMRASVGDRPITTSAGDLHVTISLGVAEATKHTDDIHVLFERADQAMYRAKRMGRDQVQS